MFNDNVFINPEDNESFKKNGFLVIPNLLNEAAIQALKNTYLELYSEAELRIPFFTTHWSPNKQYRDKVHTSVSQILAPLIYPLLNNYKNILGYYLTKMPGGNNATVLHQDWTLVDETKYIGITFWCPLTNVSFQNGCFQVVKRSHNFYNNIRGTNISLPYAKFSNDIEKSFMTSFEIEVGNVVVFDHKTIHASPPNLSNEVRVAAGMILVPEEAEVIHYIQQDNCIKKYKTDEHFLHSFNYNYKKPEVGLFDSSKYQLIDKIDASENESTFEEFVALYNLFDQ